MKTLNISRSCLVRISTVEFIVRVKYTKSPHGFFQRTVPVIDFLEEIAVGFNKILCCAHSRIFRLILEKVSMKLMIKMTEVTCMIELSIVDAMLILFLKADLETVCHVKRERYGKYDKHSFR